jgi:hypothetical protein
VFSLVDPKQTGRKRWQFPAGPNHGQYSLQDALRSQRAISAATPVPNPHGIAGIKLRHLAPPDFRSRPRGIRMLDMLHPITMNTPWAQSRSSARSMNVC